MGKTLKYGEFSFAAPKQRPTTGSYRSTKGISKSVYDQPHGMKEGGYAKGGQKMAAKREPEAVVKREVALLKKAGAPKALIQHEVREVKGEMDTPATKKAEVAMLRKAKAPLQMIKHEMTEPTAMKKGGKACYAEGGKVKMQKKVGKVMSEFKEGTLHSGKDGPVVKNPKQAIAIALSEGRKATKKADGGQISMPKARDSQREEANEDILSELSRKYGSAITEGERARATQGAREMDMIRKAQQADQMIRQKSPVGATMTEGERRMLQRSRITETPEEQAKMLGRPAYKKGGSVESKLQKHANMPASMAHGPGAAAKLKRGGVPTFSKLPKIGRMK